MSNINEERRYTCIASRIESFMLDIMKDVSTDIKLSNKADKSVFDLLFAAQNKALDIAISFEDRAKENM